MSINPPKPTEDVPPHFVTTRPDGSLVISAQYPVFSGSERPVLAAFFVLLALSLFIVQAPLLLILLLLALPANSVLIYWLVQRGEGVMLVVDASVIAVTERGADVLRVVPHQTVEEIVAVQDAAVPTRYALVAGMEGGRKITLLPRLTQRQARYLEHVIGEHLGMEI